MHNQYLFLINSYKYFKNNLMFFQQFLKTYSQQNKIFFFSLLLKTILYLLLHQILKIFIQFISMSLLLVYFL